MVGKAHLTLRYWSPYISHFSARYSAEKCEIYGLQYLSVRCALPTIALVFFFSLLTTVASAVDIQLPPETGAFKQAAGAELANGQCLVCHSVEYVTTQPRMGRTFWKASVVKMQQKYGAPIPDA